MDRRKFISVAGAAATLPFWLQGCSSSRSYEVDVYSDHHIGHLLFESQSWPVKKMGQIDLAIVGGGISGLAAAYKHQKSDFQLFELSKSLGGSSSAVNHHGIMICQGAHYDLDYPDYYGKEVIDLLNKLKIIKYQPWTKTWSFVDHKHLIPAYRKQQCIKGSQSSKTVLPDGKEKTNFLELMAIYEGKLPMPTRLIGSDLKHLNDINFLDFLNQNSFECSQEFRKGLDYHMRDDYGAPSIEVSALAGIHYFACRPYYRKQVKLFSAPSGNRYFVHKLSRSLDNSRLKTSHLVSRINDGNRFEIEVLDIHNQTRQLWSSEEVIYAGQKHALKYVFPEEYHFFEENETSPWMVVNLVTDQEVSQYGYWQNEFPDEQNGFIGFIDSSVQDQTSLNGKRIFTGYYCLKPKDREYLTTIKKHKDEIVEDVLDKVTKATGKKFSIQKAFIKVMGHAIPIPQPGYLLRDANSKKPKLRYAGVDNGRLPLLIEAIDSGLVAF